MESNRSPFFRTIYTKTKIMARVMKRFQTEAEYEEWKNSPSAMRPYTCYVLETGNIHYDDGKDDDYSITYVVRRPGWCKLFSIRMAPYYTRYGIENPFGIKVYINGELIPFDGGRFTGRGAYYKFDYYDENTEDFEYNPGLCAKGKEANIERGLRYNQFTGFWEMPMHKVFIYRYFSNRLRGVFARKGDIIKVEFSNPFATDDGRPFWENNDVLREFDWAKTICLGGGIKDTTFIKNNRVGKLFCGNGIEHVNLHNLSGRDQRKSKIFIPKQTEINGTGSNLRIVYYL